jgi:hypothetical protein
MKKSTVIKLLGYGRIVMLAVILLFLYLDFIVLEKTAIDFAMIGKYVQPAIGLVIMQYVYRRQRIDSE